ncbi:MAG: 16S rRNA (guanine(527)-N(7))-methyltransferase RsmG [Parcubacteria group bacterium]|nr:16S rRNA (guanine(527)-N(7))-methyltransferase RsmG [Parcubacteria group bacterium]
MRQLFLDTFSSFGLTLSNKIAGQFEHYANLLLEWNQKFNLTRITKPEEIVVKHFLDSASVLKVMPDPKRIVDIGSGAGFPGVVLKIMCPQAKLVLIEANKKKASFLRHLASELNLAKTEVLEERAEVVGHKKEYRESFDLATGRAVAELAVLAEYALPLLTRDGLLVAQKSGEVSTELKRAEKSLTILGGAVMRIESVHLPSLRNERFLIVIKKIEPTPPDYPRSIGVAKKHPLGP